MVPCDSQGRACSFQSLKHSPIREALVPLGLLFAQQYPFGVMLCSDITASNSAFSTDCRAFVVELIYTMNSPAAKPQRL